MILYIMTFIYLFSTACILSSIDFIIMKCIKKTMIIISSFMIVVASFALIILPINEMPTLTGSYDIGTKSFVLTDYNR